VLIAARDGTLLEANLTAQSLLNTSANQLRGRHLRAVPALIERVDAARRALDGDQSISERAVMVGETPVDAHFTPVTIDGEERLLIELVPLTRQLELADLASREVQQHALAEVLRALGHEIKNPLGGLRGAAQLLASKIDDAALAEYTRVIIAEADRLAELVDRFQRPAAAGVEFAPLNVHEILQHVAALAQAEYPGTLEIARDYDPSIPELAGHRDRLVQMLLNLVRNAAEAGAGRITLRSRIRRRVAIGPTDHRNVIALAVIDDAGGVDPELRELLFYPLVTGRSEGTGLGLAIAQQIAAEHGGILRYRPREGGSQFEALLPLEVTARGAGTEGGRKEGGSEGPGDHTLASG